MKKIINLTKKSDDKFMEFINKIDLKCCLCIFLCLFCSTLFSSITNKYNIVFIDKIFVLLSVLFFSNSYKEFMKQIKRKH